MLYSSFTPSLINNSAQNLLRNLRSQSVISSPGKPQLIKSNRLRKAYAHYFADQVFAPTIKMTHFENLHITDMITLNPCLVSGSAHTKSSNSVKKSIGRKFIGCKDL